MQNLKNNWLWFGKWQEEFGKLLPKHLKFSKFELWWDPFIQSRKFLSLKFRCHELGELWVSKFYTLMGSFLPKYLILELKKHRDLRKTELCFQKWHEDFGKFLQAGKMWFHFRE